MPGRGRAPSPLALGFPENRVDGRAAPVWRAGHLSACLRPGRRPRQAQDRRAAYLLSTLDRFAITIVRSRWNGSALHAHAGSVRAADVRARIAGFLIRANEAGRALVSGVSGDALVVVLGSAGGHETMGRAEMAAGRLPGGIPLTQGDGIERFVLERPAAVRSVSRPVLRGPVRGG